MKHHVHCAEQPLGCKTQRNYDIQFLIVAKHMTNHFQHAEQPMGCKLRHSCFIVATHETSSTMHACYRSHLATSPKIALARTSDTPTSTYATPATTNHPTICDTNHMKRHLQLPTIPPGSPLYWAAFPAGFGNLYSATFPNGFGNFSGCIRQLIPVYSETSPIVFRNSCIRTTWIWQLNGWIRQL